MIYLTGVGVGWGRLEKLAKLGVHFQIVLFFSEKGLVLLSKQMYVLTCVVPNLFIHIQVLQAYQS